MADLITSRFLVLLMTIALACNGSKDDLHSQDHDRQNGPSDQNCCACPSNEAGVRDGETSICPAVCHTTDGPKDVTVSSDRYIGGNPSFAEAIGAGMLKINDVIYQATGFGNTFMVVTDEGNVIIDTSLLANAQSHKQRLQEIDKGNIKYIILTHGHGDHTGGVPIWKEENTEVIAQDNYVEFIHYQARLAGLLGHRNSQQFPSLFGGTTLPYAAPDAEVDNYAGNIEATILFDAFYEFKLGGLTFQMVHTPGETYDHLTVWIPEYKIAFPGDNFYGAFPNIYTLRGTKPRWALDYVESLNKVLSWKPEIVAPSHGEPLYGNDIDQSITRYRDAILYVHDETVRGMNAGKDVYTLMQEIRLPDSLGVAEAYGNIPWTVRGIYEGYVGWFDGNISSMYPTSPKSIYGEVVAMAGGADALADRASQMVDEGKLHEALHMTDLALEADAGNAAALEARLKALKELRDKSVNVNEVGWLDSAIGMIEDSQS